MINVDATDINAKVRERFLKKPDNNGYFFIIKTNRQEQPSEYLLVYIKRTMRDNRDNNDVAIISVQIPEDKVVGLFSAVGKSTRAEKFIGSNKASIDDVKQKLSRSEFNELARVMIDCNPAIRSKDEEKLLHELNAEFNYKQMKNKYTFFKGFTLHDDEREKLQDSILKSLVVAIEDNPNVNRSIVIKGYTGALNYDKKEKRFYVVSRPVYSNINDNEASIDLEALKEDHKKKIKNMDLEPSADTKSSAKSIKVTTRPK
jgi:hypothetical protein